MMALTSSVKVVAMCCLGGLLLECCEGFSSGKSYGLPYFTSVGKKYRVQTGSDVTFHCNAENLGTSTILWKKAGRMISAGDRLIRKDTRMSLLGQSLRISSITEEDKGEYICEIETYGEPLDQVHSLEVLVPPSVVSKPVSGVEQSDGGFVVRNGSTITLECTPRGNPVPTITWSRENNMLPSGDKTAEGNSLVIQGVTRHHSGVYICTADNGLNHPASARINLQILYPPEIEAEQSWIKSSDGIEAEVSCIVHAEPPAEVKWYKETMLLEPTNKRHMETFGNRHLLVLRHVSEEDFGNYSCLADNNLGRLRKSVEVSGRPHSAKVTSPHVSFSKDQYNLTWTVDSFLPVTEYRLLYRVVLKPTEDGLGGYNGINRHTEWTNIIPTMGYQSYRMEGGTKSFTYTGSFNFYGLEAASQYEVIIQSRNREGWSEPSQIFRFSTRNTGYNPREMELQKSHQQSFFSNLGCRSAPSLIPIVVAIVLSALTSTLCHE